ncbi:MAG: sialate O-acetylesterase [Phycisphaerae bacterium]|nr:sialate O-acetylesterase [Phycisphaerae bacterium]
MRLSKHVYNFCLYLFLIAIVFSGTVYAGKPLKVFILAGQSNMEGHGEMIGTSSGHLETLVANDPATFGHLKDGNGNWAVRDDVWIWYQRLSATGADDGLVKGGLSVGYGRSNTTIGPELQFGNVMGDFYEAPVFILKIAAGGKSLGYDFLSPSSGWDEIPTADGKRGYYYKMILDVVADFKADPLSFCDGYNPADGYEIVGLGWHQGYNDRVTPAMDAAYEANMVNFIKDIRADLGLPNLPFSISTTGMGGGSPSTGTEFGQLAMANFTKYPSFIGGVAVDDTRPYWREVAVSPADQGYHWNRSAETYFLIGQGMGEGMADLLVDPDAPDIDAGVDMITWSGEPVILDPNIVERDGSDWTDLTYKWNPKPTTGVVFSNDAIASPIITITKPTNNPSTVTLVLKVNDASRIGLSGRSGYSVKNTITIDVYDDPCKAAIGKGLSADHPADLDGNCIIDIVDFAEFALQWLSNDVPSAAIRK